MLVGRSNLVRGIFSTSNRTITATSWRLLFTAGHDPKQLNLTIAKINFRRELGVDGLMDGTVSASGYDTTWYPQNAISTDPSLVWITNSGSVVGSWWRMDFSTPQTIKQITLKASYNTQSLAQMMKSCIVQASNSNGATWYNVREINNQTGWAFNEIRTFNLV